MVGNGSINTLRAARRVLLPRSERAGNEEYALSRMDEEREAARNQDNQSEPGYPFGVLVVTYRIGYKEKLMKEILKLYKTLKGSW